MVAEDGAGALDAVHEHDDVPHGRHLGRLGVGAGGGDEASCSNGAEREVLEGSGSARGRGRPLCCV